MGLTRSGSVFDHANGGVIEANWPVVHYQSHPLSPNLMEKFVQDTAVTVNSAKWLT